MRNYKGFTLVELLISLAIVGIITAIAVPTYRESVRKANRSDAQITLAELSTQQERYYFRTNSYTGDFRDIVTGLSGSTAVTTVASDNGHYSIALTLTGGGTGWTMVATATGDQLKDTSCKTFTMTSLGAKTATNSANANSTNDCW